MSINESDFGESMRPKTWVGTFVMNVYCEAIAYDHNKELPPKKKKGFLTSAEVVSYIYKICCVFFQKYIYA